MSTVNKTINDIKTAARDRMIQGFESSEEVDNILDSLVEELRDHFEREKEFVPDEEEEDEEEEDEEEEEEEENYDSDTEDEEIPARFEQPTQVRLSPVIIRIIPKIPNYVLETDHHFLLKFKGPDHIVVGIVIGIVNIDDLSSVDRDSVHPLTEEERALALSVGLTISDELFPTFIGVKANSKR